jgi:hypothetical protein
MPQTITYQGPMVLAGAFAHLLRQEGVDFDRPREDRTGVVEAVVVVLAVRAGDTLIDGTLDARIDAAFAKFEKRFGHDVASIELSHSEGQP